MVHSLKAMVLVFVVWQDSIKPQTLNSQFWPVVVGDLSVINNTKTEVEQANA